MVYQIDREAFRAALKNVQYITKKPIAAEVSAKLPRDSNVMAFHKAKDMDDKEYEALMVSFTDKSGVRVANFRLHDGSYVDDFIL